MYQFRGVEWAVSKIVLVAFLLLFGSSSLLAQVNASITGRVVDSSGAAVPQASVTVQSMETGEIRTVTSDDSGSYRVLQLPVGRYSVKGEKQGFKVRLQEGVNLVVGQEAVVDLALEIGQVEQQVTVTSEAPIVNTTTEAVSGLVDEQTVKDLPLNGRSFDNLIALNAGAYSLTGLKNSGAGEQQGNVFSVSGRRYSENLFLLNGVEYMGPSQVHSEPGGVSGQLLGIDAVREFNVLTDTYSAEYGKRAGGQIDIVTMSGTNQLHGTVFEFIRNSALDAKNYFDHPIVGRIPPFKRNQFGGALGGPIQKDKTFVFGNYEGFRQRLAVSDVSFVPDANARLGILPCGVISPLPAGCSGTTGTTPTAVPKLVTGMLPFLTNYWPAANGPELGGGVAENFSNPLQSIREDLGIARVDHNFSEKDTVGVSYLIDDGYDQNPQANPLWYQNVDIRSQVLSIQETHIFSPNVINNFTAGYSRASFFFITPPAPGITIPTSLAMITPVDGGPQLFGRISIGGTTNTTNGGTITTGGSTLAADYHNFRNAFTYQDVLQVIKGRNQFSFGAWFQRLRSNEFAPQDQAGVASFQTLTTLLQDTLQSFLVPPVQTRQDWRQWEGAWFVEDKIQVRHNLTASLGLRHEFTNGWNEASGHASNYYFQNGILQTNPVVGSSVYSQNNSRWLFGPRVGLAWDVFGNGKTSVRAGFGTYYDIQDSLGNTLDHNYPFNGILTYTAQPLLPLIPVNPSTPLPPICGPGVSPCSLFSPGGIQQNIKTPTVEEWNLSVEQGLGGNMSLRLAYVGSHGYREIDSDNPNTIDPVVCANASGCLAGGAAAFNAPTNASLRSTVAQGTTYIPVEPVPNTFISTATWLDDLGMSNYNAGSVELTRRMAGGLQLKTSYTWAKELDIQDGYSGDPGVGSEQDFWHAKLTGYGPSANNQEQRFVFSGSYQLPIGRNKPFLSGVTGAADKLLSGWQVNSILTIATGIPFGVTSGVNQSGNASTGAGTDRPSFAAGLNASSPIVTPNPSQWPSLATPVWFTAQDFVLPQRGTFGNTGKNFLVGPNYRDVDFSIFKTTRVNEKLSAEFRAEAFNLFNRANFTNPLTGAQSVFSSATTYSPTAGVIQGTANTSRQMQFGLKLIF